MSVETKPRITVIGSINQDLVVRCPTLPSPGETVLADTSEEICGGKGANQAVAAARAGGAVSMIGRVGDDAFAERLRMNLSADGIDTTHVSRTSDCPSGLAVVAVDGRGENAILVVPNANGRVSVDDVRAARAVIESSAVVLLQLEIPQETVLAAIAMARAAGVRVIVDPAPAPVEWSAALLGVDLLCPNESEAAALVGHAVDTHEQAERAARTLHSQGAANVAITRGERGTLLFDGREMHWLAPFPVSTVDSTAAGDAFAGALAVHWASTDQLVEAVHLGNVAGALAASRKGAQPSMAFKAELEKLGASS